MLPLYGFIFLKSQHWFNNNHRDSKTIILDNIVGLIFFVSNQKTNGVVKVDLKGIATEGFRKNILNYFKKQSHGVSHHPTTCFTSSK